MLSGTIREEERDKGPRLRGGRGWKERKVHCGPGSLQPRSQQVGTAEESDPLTTQACMRPTSPAPDRGSSRPEDCAHQAGVGKSGKRERGIDGWRGTHGQDGTRNDREEITRWWCVPLSTINYHPKKEEGRYGGAPTSRLIGTGPSVASNTTEKAVGSLGNPDR